MARQLLASVRMLLCCGCCTAAAALYVTGLQQNENESGVVHSVRDW